LSNGRSTCIPTVLLRGLVIDDESTTEQAQDGCEAENAFNREEEGKENRRGRSHVTADQRQESLCVIRHFLRI